MKMNSLRRKLAIATWDAPREGNIYGKLTVDVTNALAWLDRKKETGEKLTITHLVGKAVAVALTKAPGLNGRIRFGKFIQHPWVNVTFLVSLEEGSDLAKATVRDADRKSVAEIAADLRAAAGKLHRGEDDAFNKNKGLIRLLPSFALGWVVRTVGYLTSILGVNAPALGLEAFPFGSAIITNVGVFGLDEGFAPPTPFAHVPVYVLMGAVKDSPVVIDGQIVVRKTLTITATIDHRFMDGAQGGMLAKVVRQGLEDPDSLETA
jgi:pyruvate dehydrogenase E2 component (dihydrolipoamide acetyltransferase)